MVNANKCDLKIKISLLIGGNFQLELDFIVIDGYLPHHAWGAFVGDVIASFLCVNFE